MDWFRAHHGIANDVKLSIVAAKLDFPRCEVGWVWVILLDHASQNVEDRGNIGNLQIDEIAMMAGISREKTEKILEALRERKMLTKSGRLTAWNKRNPTGDPTNAERQRRYRERNNVTVTPVTERNALRNTEQNRVEQIRTDKNNNITPEPAADAEVVPPPCETEWPRTIAEIRRHDPAVDDMFVLRLAQSTIQQALSHPQFPRGKLDQITDKLLAGACKESYSTGPKTHGAGLLLSRVPKIVISWGVEAAKEAHG